MNKKRQLTAYKTIAVIVAFFVGGLIFNAGEAWLGIAVAVALPLGLIYKFIMKEEDK